ncbi:diguanylate cyclase with PAS/PAC sensor [Halopolyspora algeriensis]|uniref:Diguanylate cyclase with PAS/PAC sensor n=1 Tax=Halopolyspora algeriensis TaxID=1500506 RepID=A0A368VXS7_9ACTN|nr:sensor domain-containing diguanylate cyclase [Halopolyspora algeriensis]RCW47006.1 diguanylate cyclase with PAS/PAC sensor [Halopolyspora algeriensis]TQM48094.1 diguanylate cyclase with PAS/PAC sensor [Halopolyspora algeriensis]
MAARESGTVDEIPWQAVCDQAAGPVALLDLDGRILYANPALCSMLGYDCEDILHRRPPEFTHPDDPPLDRAAITKLIEGPSDTSEAEKRMVRSDGTVVWILISGSIIRDTDGNPRGFLSQIHDITDRRNSELLWRRTLTSAPIGMALIDLTGRWTEVNERLCELIGYDRDDMLAMHFTDLTYAGDDKRGEAVLTDLLSGRENATTLEMRYRHKEGHPIWMLVRISVVPGADDHPAYLISQYEAIGDGRMGDAHLAHMALHDPLTGLANRALLDDRFKQELAELPGTGGVLAVLVADMDGLKRVNDNYGHSVGDQFLTIAADELLNTVRSGSTVARFGGDEFVVLSRAESNQQAEELRDRVVEHLQTELVVSGHHVSVRASVGLAVTRNPATSAQALLHSADRDMYRRKRGART